MSFFLTKFRYGIKYTNRIKVTKASTICQNIYFRNNEIFATQSMYSMENDDTGKYFVIPRKKYKRMVLYSCQKINEVLSIYSR